ncbi:hypothetical protein K503DRAFT_867697 [Rhizopogon vinicolor AM-OR11-026]|uniref:Uncharacterized protein n=1 Tax=Rhizopogon vinicolor AM-OR11-026 TaxID=1314800 RepID=A0A1B7MUH2_9AGAM|nr:hypothetical protein K503DRAFT_867697 [Rhizopogon vinicolor AM-OR11-026]
MLGKKVIFMCINDSPGECLDSATSIAVILGKYNTAVEGALPFTTTNMPFRKISRDVKLAAVNLCEHEHLSLEQIPDCVGFSERTFWRILKLRKKTFTISCLVHHRPDWFLDEMLDLLDDNRLTAVHFSTIYRGLVRAGISCKWLKKIAREQNEERRADFVRRMAQYAIRSIRYCNHRTQSSWD